MDQGRRDASELLVTPIEEGLYYQAAERIAYHMNFSCKDYFELSVQKDFGLLIKRYLLNGLHVETFEDYAECFEIDLFRPWHRCVLTDGGLKHKELRIEKQEMLKSEYLCNSSIQRLKGLDSSAKKRANQLAEAFEECKETNRLYDGAAAES